MIDERESGSGATGGSAGGPTGVAGSAGDDRGSLTGLAVRVFTVQVIVLVLLWLLQSNYGGG